MTTKNTNKQRAQDWREVVLMIKILIGLGLVGLFGHEALNNGKSMQFNEMLNGCMSSNEYIVMHHSDNSRVEYEIDCKVTVYKGVPVEFSGGE